jgi:zinc transporter ZupT
MEPIIVFLLYSALLIAVSLIAAYLPMAGKLKDERAHLMIALSTGIFLGLLLFMLMPEGVEESEEGGIDTHYAMMVLALGFIVILVMEVLMKHKHIATCGCHSEEHAHELTSLSSYIGLAIHAACDGLALAAMFMAGEEVGLMATVGLCIHKFTELFSLSSTMLLTDLGNRKSMIRLGIFALITPVAGILCFLFFNDLEVEGLLGIPLMFAAGTLMCVTMCDMLPEAFHREHDDMKSLAMVLAGIALMLVIALLFPHSH